MQHALLPALPQNMHQRTPRRRKLTRLRPLLDHLRRHTHRTRCYFAQARCCHVYERALALRVAPKPFYAVVGYEEEGCAGGGSDNCAADAPVYTGETAARGEARRGLQARF